LPLYIFKNDYQELNSFVGQVRQAVHNPFAFRQNNIRECRISAIPALVPGWIIRLH